ncbi:hypothetical protein [Planktomarina sp.]|uniref:hypothetical protein n=1 Tax=Planktomarina sp. TaxID=2024851 RepID=UPI003260EC5D
MSAVGACAGFGAIWLLLATAATMGQVALPELRRFGYPDPVHRRIGGRGYVGHFDPAFCHFGDHAILAEQNIAKLFVAALFPVFWLRLVI